MRKITNSDVKHMNKNRVFNYIYYEKQVSRQDIADTLMLSLPTVNQNLKILSDEKLITYEGNFSSTGGRKAQIITVNPYARLVVNISIMPDKFKIILMGLDGSNIDERIVDKTFKPDATYEKAIVSNMNELVKNYGTDGILGVGITIPGIIDEAEDMLVSAPTLGVKMYSLNRLRKQIPYTCKIINDARSEAYADYWKRNTISQLNKEESPIGRKCLYIMLNDGVGGAFITDNIVETGIHNKCGEFGHMTLYPHGKKCLCGKRGCFEQYVSSNCISKDIGLSLEEFFIKVSQKSSKELKIFEKYIDDLTTGINNLYIMMDTDIILGGPVAKYLSDYDTMIKEKLVEKYSFETRAEYIHYALNEKLDNIGVGLMFLSDFVSSL